MSFKSVQDIINHYKKELNQMEPDKQAATARREQMAARFKPGGDKYESIKNDEVQDLIEAEQESLRIEALLQDDTE